MSVLSLIVAMDENNLIGRANDLPWRLPADLAYFKSTTMGKPIIMGRNTHESIGNPLPGRNNIVITRQTDYQAPGCTVVAGLKQARIAAGAVDEVLVIGGAQVYRQALPEAERLYVTRVHARLEGDAWFPDVDWTQWRKLSSERHDSDERNAFPYSFERWEKIKLG